MAFELDLKSLRTAREKRRSQSALGVLEPNEPLDVPEPRIGEVESLPVTKRRDYGERMVLDIQSLRSAREKRRGQKLVADQEAAEVYDTIPSITPGVISDPKGLPQGLPKTTSLPSERISRPQFRTTPRDIRPPYTAPKGTPTTIGPAPEPMGYIAPPRPEGWKRASLIEKITYALTESKANYLLERFGKQLANAFARIGETAISHPLSPIGISQKETEQYRERATRELEKTGFKGGPAQKQQLISARAAALAAAEQVPKFKLAPPQERAEKVTDVAAGLTAFITQLALTKKILPKGTPDPVIWEIQNQATGGRPGEGAAMRLALGGIGKIPTGTLPGKLGKVGLESGLFAGYTAAMGGSAEDIIISGLIPITFNAWNFAKQRHHITTYEKNLNAQALQKHQQRLKQGMNPATSQVYLKADKRIIDTAVAKAKQTIYRDDAFAPAREKWEAQRKKALNMIATGKPEAVKRGNAILDFLARKPLPSGKPIEAQIKEIKAAGKAVSKERFKIPAEPTAPKPKPIAAAKPTAGMVQPPKLELKKPAEAVKPSEIETLAKELEKSLNLSPERALEVAAKKLAYDAAKAAEKVEKPPVERMSDRELRESYLSLKPTSPEWVAVLKEIKRRKIDKAKPAEPVAAESSQQIYDRLISKWGQSAYDKAQEFLIEQDETYQEIEGKFVDLDAKGLSESPEAQGLERQLFGLIENRLKGLQKKPAEPSVAKPEAKPEVKAWAIINSRGQQLGKETFATREEAQRNLEKRITSPIAQTQFSIQPITPAEPAKPVPKEVAEVKPHAIELLPRKAALLTEIKEAVAKAPSETELRKRLQIEIPEPASTLPTEEYTKDMRAKAKQIADEVDKIRAEKVKFDIDGGATIINTREALQDFYNQVSKTKEKETWPRRPTAKAKGVGKPVAAKQEHIEELHKAPEGYFTDGRVIVKGTPPAKAKVSDEAKEISQKQIDELLAEDTQPAELMYFALSSDEAKGISGEPVPGALYETFAVFKSEGKYYTFVQRKFNVIRNRYPEAKYGISPKRGKLTAYDKSTEKPVAALMPLDIGKEGPAIDKPPVEITPAQEELQPSIFEPDVDVKGLQIERQQRKAAAQPEPTHPSKIVVEGFREWPEPIRKVGKDYWVELMAVAKSFMTPLRYKALRKTMLGVFRYKKGLTPQAVAVELQDVRDALTATHEIGHEFDWLLSNRRYPSSIKARFDDPEAKEMTLRAELKKVSNIIRPDLWRGTPVKVKYVSRHTELMADFISHYILDPEKTRELAPTVTPLFEAKLATNPQVYDAVSHLIKVRYEGPEKSPITEHIRDVFPLPKEFNPLQLIVDMSGESYVKAAEELGITAARHYKVLMQRARRDADRIDSLVPDKARQADLVVVVENGSKNPWTGKTRQEILAEGLNADERKAVNLYRGYQELARQTVNKYLRGADIAEYIKFIDDYFIHAYHTPLTEKYKTAISRWAKRSPQAKKRVLPDLNTAVEMGLKPRAKTLSDGLTLWAGMNFRVATNKAFLRILPRINNEDGISILQKPQDFPMWPTVDYWPIRQTYAIPLPNRGVLLFQGRVAVDPKVKPFIDAMFGKRAFNTPVRIIEGFNAIAKAFELTLFSLFHHQAEFFSACGSLGPRALPFVGGYYGRKAQVFGIKPKLWGLLPAHIGVLKAGKQLEKCPEFMDDYLAHGGQVGYITTEGIGLMERMLKRAADFLENIVQYKPTGLLTGVYAAAYVPVKTAQAAYSFHQRLLWDNVQRAKLVTYYHIVADGAKHSDLPIKEVKELAAEYIADNYGGQEWLNTIFRKPKVRQFWTQLWMSLDWTWSQIKTARWTVGIGGKSAARRAFMRKIGRHHWFWYLAAISSFTIAGCYALSGKDPSENEKGHKLDIDWTKLWRALPWNRDWEERGDYAHRYITIGKAGRELVRWVTSPLRAFGYKLSPGARTLFEQATGFNMGSRFPEPWAREDMELYKELYHRFGNVMEKFKPFSLSGNNAFLAFPSRKGMTEWKATRAYEEIYKARATVAMGGVGARMAKVDQIIAGSEDRLLRDIAEACDLNRVDVAKAKRAAMAGVRSKYYRLFWKSSMLPEKKAIEQCNRYAEALLELGVVPRGFKQSLSYRKDRVPLKAQKLGIKAFRETAELNLPALRATREKRRLEEKRRFEAMERTKNER